MGGTVPRAVFLSDSLSWATTARAPASPAASPPPVLILLAEPPSQQEADVFYGLVVTEHCLCILIGAEGREPKRPPPGLAQRGTRGLARRDQLSGRQGSTGLGRRWSREPVGQAGEGQGHTRGAEGTDRQGKGSLWRGGPCGKQREAGSALLPRVLRTTEDGNDQTTQLAHPRLAISPEHMKPSAPRTPCPGANRCAVLPTIWKPSRETLRRVGKRWDSPCKLTSRLLRRARVDGNQNRSQGERQILDDFACACSRRNHAGARMEHD